MIMCCICEINNFLSPLGSSFGFCLISSVVTYLYTTSLYDDLKVDMAIWSLGNREVRCHVLLLTNHGFDKAEDKISIMISHVP